MEESGHWPISYRARAALNVRTVQRWTKINGERQATTKQQAVRPWWKTDPLVKGCLHQIWGKAHRVRRVKPASRSRPRKATEIDTLIAPVRAGELDELFRQAAKAGSIGKARKAA